MVLIEVEQVLGRQPRTGRPACGGRAHVRLVDGMTVVEVARGRAPCLEAV
jgi:hypothetical protein